MCHALPSRGMPGSGDQAEVLYFQANTFPGRYVQLQHGMGESGFEEQDEPAPCETVGGSLPVNLGQSRR